MIKIIFSEFFKGKYDDPGYELYIIRNLEKEILYIGISKFSTWHRWFGGGTSHMDVDSKGDVHAKSPIAEVIERRFPESWNWPMELLTKEDCCEMLVGEFGGKDRQKISIDTIEAILIKKLQPLYNVMHGGGYNEDPAITKKLDDAYRKLFD